MVNKQILLTLAVASTGAVAAPFGPCNAIYNACRTAPGANMAVCAAEHEACLSGVSKRDVTPSVGSPVGFNADGENCEQKYNDCRTAPGANMAVCASEHAECTGESSDDDSDDDSSSASSTATATATATTSAVSATGTSSSGDCETKFNECRSAPGANMAVCSAEHAKCKGSSSGSGSTSTASASGASSTSTGAASGSGASTTTGAASGPAETTSPSSASGTATSASPSSSPTETSAAGRLEVGGSIFAALLVAIGLF